jgi:hypothetical protein
VRRSKASKVGGRRRFIHEGAGGYSGCWRLRRDRAAGERARTIDCRAASGSAILNFAGPSLYKLGDEEQQGGADRGGDDRAGSSGTKMDTEQRNQPDASKGTNSSDYYVTNPTARPTNKEIFDRQVHSGPVTEICLNSHKASTGRTTIAEALVNVAGRGCRRQGRKPPRPDRRPSWARKFDVRLPQVGHGYWTAEEPAPRGGKAAGVFVRWRRGGDGGRGLRAMLRMPDRSPQ